MCGQAHYLLPELSTLRPVVARNKEHYLDLVRVCMGCKMKLVWLWAGRGRSRR